MTNQPIPEGFCLGYTHQGITDVEATRCAEVADFVGPAIHSIEQLRQQRRDREEQDE